MMVRSSAEERNSELKLFQVPLGVPTTPYSGPAWRGAGRAPWVLARARTMESSGAQQRQGPRQPARWADTHAPRYALSQKPCASGVHATAPGMLLATVMSRQVLSELHVDAFK